MTFRVTQKTLEALEWRQVVALLAAQCRTAQGRVLLESDEADGMAALFETELEGVRTRLAETSEARAMLDDDLLPPLGATAPLDHALARAEKGAVIELTELIDLHGTLKTLHAVARHARAQAESAPEIAALGEQIEEQRELEQEIERCIDPAGEVRDSASPALAQARQETQRLSGELQRRLARYLQNPAITSHLSDSYYTVRNDRYVLPVRADARSQVRGIVHDASRSGTTLFVEPEAVVEVNNRLKQAELTIVREIDRILRRLSAQIAHVADALRAGLAALGAIDLAFARGRLSQQMDAVLPEVARDGVIAVDLLRHPLIERDECVPNDIRLGEQWSVLVISGPNAGGKTVAMKSVALGALMLRAGLHIPCEPGARFDLFDRVLVDIGDGQDIGESLSTFSAHMANLAEIVSVAGPASLVLLDEIGVGTDPGEGASLAQSILESLCDVGARVITTTHYNLLKEMADVHPRFCNASVEFDPETLAPTYRLHIGHAGISSAASVAARMGMPSRVLERAHALLQREDRQLDRMLAELATSRAALQSEQQQAAALRAESEAVRNEYRSKLERLQERRDTLFRSMRDELDGAFKTAHREVASVIADLQQSPSSRKAAAAREQLQTLQSHAEKAERAAGIEPGGSKEPGLRPVDWRRARAGDAVLLDGGRKAVLVSLPDRKGRVGVRMGSAKLVMPAERVGQVGHSNSDAPSEKARARVQVQRADPDAGPSFLGGGIDRCDLRGARVEEALDRLSDALDRAIADGRDELVVIHGHGTGALRDAVRRHLRESPHALSHRAGSDDEGGEGVTHIEIR